MKNKVSIITGASGEIGQNLINYFSKIENKKIIALDVYKPKKNIKIFKFIKGSILDNNLIAKIKKETPDLFHLLNA